VEPKDKAAFLLREKEQQHLPGTLVQRLCLSSCSLGEKHRITGRGSRFHSAFQIIPKGEKKRKKQQKKTDSQDCSWQLQQCPSTGKQAMRI
jgi:hypothetical protein